jgi:hypothetical protein
MKRRHLVMVHQDGAQDVADFHAIAGRVRTTAPDIEVSSSTPAGGEPLRCDRSSFRQGHSADSGRCEGQSLPGAR